MDIMVVGKSESHFLQIVATLCSSRGFAGLLDSRQQQRYKNGYDGNNNEQLDKREA